MLIYKFRITLEENDDFLREIDIKPGQTFEDFHNAILECVTLTKGELASFYICDIKWRKHQEITLKKDKDILARAKENAPPAMIMSKTVLSSCINNPNEQLIYIYDFQTLHTFYIELFKIYNTESNQAFPRCVKSVSDVPKTITIVPNSGEEIIDDEEPSEFEDEFEDNQVIDDNDGIFGDFFEESNTNESNP
jgi:hypothetical protein